MWRFWLLRGRFGEGRAFLAEALSRPEAGGRTATRAKALKAAGTLAFYQDDHEAARALSEECLAVFRELGDRRGVAAALSGLAAALSGLAAALAPRAADEAVRLWGAVQALRESDGFHLPLNEQERYERQISQAQMSLGEDAFAAWDEGRALMWEEAVAYARQSARVECDGVP